MKEILQLASAASEAAPDQEWIQLFKLGSQMGRDGRGPYIVDDAKRIVAASMDRSTEIFIDRDHEMDLLPKGTPVRAAGWVKEMQAREDGIWARVEWTPRAKEELASKEFRYISPVFYFDSERRVQKIIRASLTNNPNLELKAVASADPETSSQPLKEKKMDETLKAIAALLGMSETADAKTILDAVKDLKANLDGAAKAAGTTVATAAAIESAIKAKAYDPAKHAPLDAVTSLTKEVASLRETVSGDQAMASVNEGVKAGKIIPALKGWALDYATKDLAGFKQYLETAPVVISTSETDTGKKPEVAAAELDQAGAAVGKLLGVSSEKMKAGLKASA